MAQKLEYTILDIVESASRYIKTNPLNLGGVSSAGGGIGGPPGGFIGQLPQTRVAYDYTEAASSGIPASGMSLLDNLNHIRYRLNIIESGASITVIDDNTPSNYNDVDTIHFSGAGVSVSNLGGGDLRVWITGGSGGSGTPLTVKDADNTPTITNVDTIIFSGASVIDLGSGDVLVTISSGSGTGTALTVQDGDGSPIVNNTDKIIFSGGFGVTDLGSGDVLITPPTINADVNHNISFYLNYETANTQEDAAYMHSLLPTRDGFASTSTSAITVPSGETKGQVFITPLGMPNVELIPAGTVKFTITGRQDSGTRAVVMFVKLYKQVLAGTQTLLATSTYTSPLTGSDVTSEVTATISSPVKLLATDRLVMKIYFNGNSVGTDGGCVITYGATTYDRMDIGLQLTSNTVKAIPIDGWIPANGVWTRSSNTAFTISTLVDLSNMYRKGTKVRYKDGGSYEYGVIASTGYNGGTFTQTINLIPNSDYAMAAATITDTYVSYIDNPEGFPGWFAYAGTWSGTGGSGFAVGNATSQWRWRAQGDTIFVKVRITAGTTTNFGTGGVLYNFSIPVNATQISNVAAMESASGNVYDGSTRYALSSFIRTSDIRGIYGSSILGSGTFAWASAWEIRLSGWYEY